jgi:hypothetical protein
VRTVAINLDTLLLNLFIQLVVNIIVLSPVLWISGRLLAGKEKAKGTDALWIVILGTVIQAALGYFITGWIATIIVLVIWLGLVKHFFDCGWLRALVISVVAVLILFVIAVVLGIIGFELGFFGSGLNPQTFFLLARVLALC